MNQDLTFGYESNLSAPLGDAELSHFPDEALIAQLLEGNSDALTVLFGRYYRMVLSVALRILRDTGEAEDLMQSVFLGIFRTAKEFDATRGTVKMWILQSAYNRAFNRRRYLNLRGIYCYSDDPRLSERSSNCVGHSVDEPELAEAVKEALNELRKSQREVVEYAFYEGLTMREIAQKTSKTFHSVRHDYYRGLEKLRCILLNKRPTDIPGRRLDTTARRNHAKRHGQGVGFSACERGYSGNSVESVQRRVPIAF